MTDGPGSSGRERANDLIPPQALAPLTVAMLVDLNFLGVPKVIIERAGRDAWISVLLGSAVTVLAVVLMFRLLRRHPGKTLVEMSEDVLGRFLGGAVGLLYALFWTAVTASIVQMQSYLFTRALLPNTPPLILTLYMLALAFYLARHGVEPLSRLCLLFLGLFLLTLVPLGLLVTARAEGARLLPIMEDGWMPVLRGAATAYAASHGTEFLLMMGAFLTTLRGGLKASCVGVALVVVPAMFVTALLVVRFGPQGSAALAWPTLSLVEVAEVPGFTGFRLDPIFLSVWTLFVFASVSFHLYLTGLALQRVFRLRSVDWTLLGTAVVVTGVCLVPVNPLDLLSMVDQTMRWMVPVFTLAIPIVLITVDAIRGSIQGQRPSGEPDPGRAGE